MKTTMRTHIFAYNGYVGVLSHPEAEHFIAHPGNGNLVCVVDAKGVDISPEALILLKQIPKSRDAIGDFDVFGKPQNYFHFFAHELYQRNIVSDLPLIFLCQ